MKKITRNQLLKLYNEAKKSIAQQTDKMEFDDTATQEERIEKALKDDKYFCKTYFPHYCTHDFSEYHDFLFKANKGRNRKFYNAVFPRDAAKDAILTVMLGCKDNLFSLRKFITIFSHTDRQATKHNLTVKAELESNSLIRQDFPDLYISGKINDFTCKRTRNLALGSGMSYRGERSGAHRPDKAILTDYEKGVSPKSRHIIQESYDYIWTEIEYALNADEGVIIFLQNLFNRRGVQGEILTKLFDLKPSTIPPYSVISKELNSYELLFVPAIISEKGKKISYWEDREPIKKLLANLNNPRKKIYFMREKLHQPTEPNSAFREEMFHTYNESELNGRELTTVIGFDPSFESNQDACFKAAIVASLDIEESKVYIRTAHIKQETMTEAITAIGELAKKYRPAVIKVEKNTVAEWLYAEFEKLKKKTNIFLNIEYIHHSTNKIERIMKLSSMIESGDIVFNDEMIGDLPELIDQFLAFPHSAVDGPDACEMCIEAINDIGYRIGYDEEMLLPEVI